MSEEQVRIGTVIDLGDSKSTLRQLQGAIKDAKIAMEGLDTSTKSYDTALSDLTIAQGDYTQAIGQTIRNQGQLQNHLNSVTNAINGTMGGFQALQGIIALTGGENEKLVSTLVKLQAVSSIAAGFKSFTTAIQGSTLAMRLFNTAVASNPLGALLVAITAVIGAMELLMGALDDTDSKIKSLENRTIDLIVNYNDSGINSKEQYQNLSPEAQVLVTERALEEKERLFKEYLKSIGKEGDKFLKKGQNILFDQNELFLNTTERQRQEIAKSLVGIHTLRTKYYEEDLERQAQGFQLNLNREIQLRKARGDSEKEILKYRVEEIDNYLEILRMNQKEIAFQKLFNQNVLIANKAAGPIRSILSDKQLIHFDNRMTEISEWNENVGIVLNEAEKLGRKVLGLNEEPSKFWDKIVGLDEQQMDMFKLFPDEFVRKLAEKYEDSSMTFSKFFGQYKNGLILLNNEIQKIGEEEIANQEAAVNKQIGNLIELIDTTVYEKELQDAIAQKKAKDDQEKANEQELESQRKAYAEQLRLKELADEELAKKHNEFNELQLKAEEELANVRLENIRKSFNTNQEALNFEYEQAEIFASKLKDLETSKDDDTLGIEDRLAAQKEYNETQSEALMQAQLIYELESQRLQLLQETSDLEDSFAQKKITNEALLQAVKEEGWIKQEEYNEILGIPKNAIEQRAMLEVEAENLEIKIELIEKELQAETLAQEEKIRLLNELNEYQDLYLKNTDNRAKAEINIRKATTDAIQSGLGLTKSALKDAGAIAGEHTAAGKVLAVAATTIDTYQSATMAYKSQLPLGPAGPALGIAAATAAVASGLANVKRILSVKVPGKGSDGQGGGMPNIQQPEFLEPVKFVQESYTNLSGDDLDIINNKNQTHKVIVVESDITNVQNRVRAVENDSTF